MDSRSSKIFTVWLRTFLCETDIPLPLQLTMVRTAMITCILGATALLHAKVPAILHTLVYASIASVQLSVQWKSQITFQCYFAVMGCPERCLRSPRFHGSLWEQLADSISGQCSWEPANTNVSPLRLLNWIQLRGLLTPKAIFLEAGTCYFLAQLCCIFPSERKVGNPKKENISENSNSRPVWNCSFCCLITIIMSINMLILDWLSSSFKMKIITKRT